MADKDVRKGEIRSYMFVWLIVLGVLSGILFGGFFEGYTVLKITYLMVLPPILTGGARKGEV